MLSRWRSTLLLLAILLLAAVLRFWGLRWGLPNALHSYSYHPDEFLTVGAAGFILTGFFPRFYNYPSLYLYLTAVAILAGSFYGFAHDSAAAYLCARVVTALMGTLAVAATYWAAKKWTPADGPAPSDSRNLGHTAPDMGSDSDNQELAVPDADNHNDRPGHVVLDAGTPGHAAPAAHAIGLLAALILCIAPLHVQHSHFATVDVPSTLFIALCLGFAFQVLTRGSLRDYILCGAMAGFAGGTKYNAGLVILSLIAAYSLGLWRKRPAPDADHAQPQTEPPEPVEESQDSEYPEPDELSAQPPTEHPVLVEGSQSSTHPEPVEPRSRPILRLLTGLACAIVAFIISTPGSIFRTGGFLYGLTYEMRHAAEGHGLVFAGTGNGFLFTFTSSLWYGLGPALAILFVASAIYGLIRLDRHALVILAFAVPYYALISLSQVRFARYGLPLFPPAAMLIAWMTTDLYKRSAARVREDGLRTMLPRIHSRAIQLVLALSLAGTLLYTIALDRLFVQAPPQDRAARWLFAHIPRGSRIGMVDVPWFYSPPYSKTAGMGSLQQRQKAAAGMPYSPTSILPPNQAYVWTQPPWAVTTDYETGEALRLRHTEGLSSADFTAVRRIASTQQELDQNYLLRASFSSSLAALGISFGSTQSLPHDMRYPAPTIWIYERQR